MRSEGGAHLDQGRVQIDVVRHDDGAHDAHGLSELGRTAALTLRHEHPLQQLALVWTHHHILDQSRNTTSHTGSTTGRIRTTQDIQL